MGSGYCSPNNGKDHTRQASGSTRGHGSIRPDYRAVGKPNEVLAHKSGGAYHDLGDPRAHPFRVGTLFFYETKVFCICLPCIPRHPTESVGASGSELPTSGTTVAGAVGTRKSTSIWCIPSSTRDYEPSDPHTPLLTRSTPNNYSGPNGLSEKTGAISVQVEMSVPD